MTDRGSPGGSTIANSEMDDQQTTHSSPTRPDPRGALSHLLTDQDNSTPMSMKRSHDMMTEDEDAATPGPSTTSKGPPRSRKRKEPAAAGSMNPLIYSGNKVKHLKKDDGEPLWRKDIQFDFLKAIFDDQQKVFTNSYEPSRPKQSFADLYIDTMARSSKTSKILKDKLLTEHTPAKNMAMVCLLVNLGRMNTTLNFFPEMRAQLRTYHAIPSLQAHQDPNSYKQLQDAPRLKSILKGASEDRPEPGTLERFKEMAGIPRTNPVNLIFVLAQFAPRITELHMPPGRDFYDLLMAEHLSSATRARAFLWLMWFYLESDFTEEGADENPFGPGVTYDPEIRNQGVPRLEVLNKEQQELENVDTPEEKEYGYTKMKERKRIIEADLALFQVENGPPKRGPKPKLHLPPDENSPATFIGRIRPKFEDAGASPAAVLGRIRPKYESDMESTRSTPPPRALGAMRIQSVLSTGAKGRGSLKHQIIEGSSPVPHPVGETIMRRTRPLTAHQLAVERNRNQRVNYILSRGLRKVHHEAKKQRKQDGAFWRAVQRTNKMPDPFEDSEDEGNMMADPTPFRERGFGGLTQLMMEEDDFGEEMAAYAAAFRRMGRRLDRWDKVQHLNLGVIGTKRIPPKGDLNANGNHEGEDSEDERPMKVSVKRPGVNGNGNVSLREAEEDLDDVDKALLGLEGQSDGEEDGENEVAEDDDLDDVDKALLGLRGDETEDEGEGSGMES